MWRTRGHDAEVRYLATALRQGRVAHALIISGPKQVGKTTFALDVAAALNCAETDPPCGQCRSCRRVLSGNHTDVQTIDLLVRDDERQAKNLGIDQIREIERTAALRPYEGAARVFILQGAERLSQEASNAFLKTLEEPPPSVYLLLLTDDADRLLPTVRSRCQQIDLRPASRAAIVASLVEAGAAEADAQALAALAQGRIGWALSTHHEPSLREQRKDQCAALLSLLDASVEEAFRWAEQVGGQFSRNRDAVFDLLELFNGLLRDLVLIRGGQEHLISNVDLQQDLVRLAASMESPQLVHLIRTVSQTRQRLRGNANPRLALEVLVLQFPQLEAVQAGPRGV